MLRPCVVLEVRIKNRDDPLLSTHGGRADEPFGEGQGQCVSDCPIFAASRVIVEPLVCEEGKQGFTQRFKVYADAVRGILDGVVSKDLSDRDSAELRHLADSVSLRVPQPRSHQERRVVAASQ